MSIHNVSNVELREIQQIDDRITHFSNSKWRIGVEHFDEIYHLLLQKQVEFAQNKDLTDSNKYTLKYLFASLGTQKQIGRKNKNLSLAFP